MKKVTARNGKVDALRFLFSIFIVLTHASYIMPKKLDNMFNGFALGVEFFFLVSGCLLMASVEKAERTSTLPLGKETGIFMLRKVKSMYPEVAVAFLLRVALGCVLSGSSFWTTVQKGWFDGALLLSSGLRGTAVMTVTWYISSMLICMMILYPFIRKFKEGAIRVVLPVGAVLILGFMLQNYGSFRGPVSWTGFTYRGNLRALAELSLGCVCYCVSKKLKEIDFNVLGRILLALIEIVCYGVFIWYMAGGISKLKDFTYLFVLCVAVTITFSEKSIGHELFNRRIFTFLGKFSLPLYLIHSTVSKRLFKLLPAAEKLGWKRRLVVYVALSLAAGFVVLLISNLIRRVGPKLMASIKKQMVKSEQ